MFLRKVVSSNIYLYIIWFYTVRKWKGDYVRLPAFGDDLYFDGYPRSGNTFFTGLLNKIYPKKKFASHLHVVAGLKLALKYKIPIFVLIRNPKDAITSNLYVKISDSGKCVNEKIIKELIHSYCTYYSYVKEYDNVINILRFESCVKNEIFAIKTIAEIAGFENKDDEFMDESLENFKARMRALENKKSTKSSSLPNKKRKMFKNKYQKQVVNSSIFREAEKIYDELGMKCIQIKN